MRGEVNITGILEYEEDHKKRNTSMG